MVDGYIDIDAGEMAISMHQGLCGWAKSTLQTLQIISKKEGDPEISEETRELYNYATKKIAYEVLAVVILVGLSTLFKAMAKGADDDEWWIRFGYL